jgi:branched-chain amino acid transport system permease protein
MIVGIALSVFLAVLIGMPTFKLRGTYFAIATIATCTIVERLLLYFKGFTGGATGLSLPNNRVYSIFTLNFENALPYFYIALGLMTLAVIVSSLVQHSRLGFYLRMIREDEDATESLGIRTYHVKLVALIISAVLTAAIGTFFAFRLRYVDPPTFASHDVAVRIGMTAIIGGMGTLWGPILGAVLTVPLLQLSNAYFGSIGGGGLAWIIYGTIIILFVLFQPNGLIALTNKVLALFKRLATKRNVLMQCPGTEDKSDKLSDVIEPDKQIPSDKDKSL